MSDSGWTDTDPDWGALLDVDVDGKGKWIGAFGEPTNWGIRTAEHTLEAPAGLGWPCIRWMNDSDYVVVGRRAREGERNGRIRSLGRSGETSFSAGDGIQDVLACTDGIVVTYFDEGVFSHVPPGREGLALFDASGTLLGGYRSTFGSSAVDVSDCYAACWMDEGRIAFVPYTDFQFVSWNLSDMSQEVHPTPEELHGVSAFTMTAGAVIFHGPYRNAGALLSWKPGGSVHLVTERFLPRGALRGLRDGRFLVRGKHGFGVIDVNKLDGG